MIFNDDFRASS